MLMYRSRSDFHVKVLLFVGQLENKRPRKLIDTYLITIDNDSATADTDSNIDQLSVLHNIV